MHAHRPPLVRSFPPTFQVGREFVPGEGRAFLNANTMKPEEIHVSGDRELPARLTLLAHIELISAGVLPLLESQVPNFHKTPFRIDLDVVGLIRGRQNCFGWGRYRLSRRFRAAI
jgi:hypothetical protein